MLLAAQPTRGLDVGAIEFVHRRLLERARRGARVLLVCSSSRRSARWPTACSSSTTARIVAELPPDASDEELGVAMTGGGRGRAGVSDRARPGPRGAGHDHRRLAAVGLRPRRRRPRAARDGAARVPRRRPRRRAHGPQPVRHLQGDLRRHRPELALPVDLAADDRTLAALNLQQTLILTTPLILTASRSPSPSAPACSTSAARASTSSADRRGLGRLARSPPCRTLLHVMLAIVARRARRAPSGPGSPGVLKATTGANEVISTIMLNWTAIWIGGLPVRARRPAADDPQRRPPGLQRRRARRAAAGLLGRPGAAGPARRASSSRSRALVVFWVLLNRSTTGYEVRAVGFNPDAARVRRHQRRRATTSR